MGTFFWVDEEPNVAFPDITELELLGHVVINQKSAGSALDWLLSPDTTLDDVTAFIIDIQLPIYDDKRFTSKLGTDGALAGLQVTRLFLDSQKFTRLSNEVQANIIARTLLYTRLPDTNRISRISLFAAERGLRFRQKKGATSMLSDLHELGFV